MSTVHGSKTVVKVGGVQLAKVDNSETKRTRDSHDDTGYGEDAHTYSKGLKDGTFTMSGTYDNTEDTGNHDVLLAAYEDDDLVEIIRQVEGAGVGKPQERFQALCTSFVETNPVADMVKWSADFQISGVIDDTDQSA